MVPDPDPSRGDEYHHPDGTVEIIFEIKDDRLLTVREYDRSDFTEPSARRLIKGSTKMSRGYRPQRCTARIRGTATLTILVQCRTAPGELG